MKFTRLAPLVLLTLAVCDSAPTTNPESARVRSRDTPQLCELEAGRYCTPAALGDATGEPALALEGWVCCAPAGTPCVAVKTFDECTMVGGYCNDYSTNDDDTVVCHD